MNGKNHIVPTIKLSFVNKNSDSKSVLGKGVVQLMRNIEEEHSLNKAAKKMNMAYSKAWRIVKNTSKALNCELVQSVRPTGSVLTPQGKMLLKLYEEMEDYLRKEAQDYFKKITKMS